MLPLLLIIGFRAGRRGLRLWLPIPLFLVWLLLLPLVLVLLPFAMLALLLVRMNPLRTLAVFWATLTSLGGTHIDVDDGQTRILIRII